MTEAGADVVIAGGGGIGSATAYFLKRLDPKLRVVVFERDPTYARASTTLAAGGIRLQFSTPENVRMSQFSYEFMTRAGEDLAVNGRKPEIGLKPLPYLRLAPAARAAEVEAQVKMQIENGASPRLLDRAELAALYPWMNFDDVDIGVLGGPGEGLFDPYGLLQALRAKAIDLGADFRTGAVSGFERDGAGRITAVSLADGRLVPCGLAVNAAGPSAGKVAAMAGFELPVAPMKANSFAFKAEAPPPNCPVVLDHVLMSQFKPEGALFLGAAPIPQGEGEPDFEPDLHAFEEIVWPLLARRVPAFETVKLSSAWAGHVEMNLFDANPVLGPHPECSNFVFANGFSGHGAQQLPAAGRAIAELITNGAYQTLDLSCFAYERLRTGARLPERL